MAKSKTTQEPAYLLKIVLYLILGTIWVKWQGKIILPIGLLLGLFFAHHEHFQIDRKIEYALLIIAALLGLIGVGIYINLFNGA